MSLIANWQRFVSPTFEIGPGPILFLLSFLTLARTRSFAPDRLSNDISVTQHYIATGVGKQADAAAHTY